MRTHTNRYLLCRDREIKAKTHHVPRQGLASVPLSLRLRRGASTEPPEALDSAGALEDLRQEIAPLFHLMPLVLPGMYQRKWGRLIGLAMHPTKRSPAYAYNVGKAARIDALLLAQERAWRRGVTVNVMAPGPVATVESLEEAIELCNHGAAWQRRTDITPQDVAEGVAFLCSEDGRFITGCVLPYSFHE